MLAVTIDGVGGEVINLSCKGAVTTAEFFAWHCRWLNKSGPMTISTGLALFLARIAAGLAKVTGKPSELTPATVHQLSTRCWYSIDKAERLLGWTPVTPLERGMAMSNQWAKEQGYVV